MRWMLGADAKVSILSTAGLSNAAPANMVPLSDSAGRNARSEPKHRES